MRRFLIAGNWKMNGTLENAKALAAGVAEGVPQSLDGVEVLVCPPFVHLAVVREALAGSGVGLGAQNAWHEPKGAFTGEVSAEMLMDAGCSAVILGHSERRHVIGETDELINEKVRAAVGAGLPVILCVGELLEEREAGRTEEVLERQMDRGLADVDADALKAVTLAYEPVWAIGTGHTATPDQAESAHSHLRKWLADRYNSDAAEATRLLYGGSVKPENAPSLLEQPNVDGALVGGASLKAETFLPIVRAAVDLSG